MKVIVAKTLWRSGLLLAAIASPAGGRYTVRLGEREILLKAGILQRVLRVAPDCLRTVWLEVGRETSSVPEAASSASACSGRSRMKGRRGDSGAETRFRPVYFGRIGTIMKIMNRGQTTLENNTIRAKYPMQDRRRN